MVSCKRDSYSIKKYLILFQLSKIPENFKNFVNKKLCPEFYTMVTINKRNIHNTHTEGENIIGATKIRNYYGAI